MLNFKVSSSPIVPSSFLVKSVEFSPEFVKRLPVKVDNLFHMVSAFLLIIVGKLVIQQFRNFFVNWITYFFKYFDSSLLFDYFRLLVISITILLATVLYLLNAFTVVLDTYCLSHKHIWLSTVFANVGDSLVRLFNFPIILIWLLIIFLSLNDFLN